MLPTLREVWKDGSSGWPLVATSGGLWAAPGRVFAPEFLAWPAERDEPVTAAEADTAGPWHVERNPKGSWAVLRQGESFKKSTRTIPTATFERRKTALLGAAVLPGTGRDPRFCLASEPDDRGHPILENGRIAGHSEYFREDFIAAVGPIKRRSCE